MANNLLTQKTDPLADSFFFDGCIVLISGHPSSWVDSIKSTFPDYVPYTSKPRSTSRLFYFPGEGLWEGFIHLNIACIVPRRIVAKGDSQVEIILKYLGLTIKNISESPEISTLVGYKIFFYLPSISVGIPVPLIDYETSGNIITKTCLGVDLQSTYKEYKTTLVFDSSWNVNKPQKAGFVPSSQIGPSGIGFHPPSSATFGGGDTQTKFNLGSWSSPSSASSSNSFMLGAKPGSLSSTPSFGPSTSQPSFGSQGFGPGSFSSASSPSAAPFGGIFGSASSGTTTSFGSFDSKKSQPKPSTVGWVPTTDSKSQFTFF